MRIVKPIAALCLLALIALHVWLFFRLLRHDSTPGFE
jgi:hypothetical protein